MTLRDQRQSEFANTWLKHRFGILNLCPRFGKIRTSIKILEQFPKDAKILIAYPDNKIKDSWKSDFKDMEYNNDNVTYTTHLSIKKYVNEVYDLVIIDEIHLLSLSQVIECKNLLFVNREILGLTGTLSMYTEKYLQKQLGLSVLANYPIAQAVEEKVISDYEITVVSVKLDDIVKKNYSGKMKTEKQYFDGLSWVIAKLEKEGKDTMFLKLKRKAVVKNSIAKLRKTKQLLKTFENERILVFCGTIAAADSLGIPSFHNKTKDKTLFEKFANGEGKQMAVIKIGNTGVTYKPLNKIILSDFDSNSENLTQKINRCMAMEYNNPEKKAYIYIVCSNEPVEKLWLAKALEFFDKNKIKYL
jgi:superfamily II DNA or RNA helicase